MNQETELLRSERLAEAEAIIAMLPEPDYGVNYQAEYPDKEALAEAMAENLTTQGVTTPHRAAAFTKELESVSNPRSPDLLVITGSCREAIQASVPITELADITEANLAVIAGSKLKRIKVAQRDRGQYKKPRSAVEEEDAKGNKIPVYMGDVVNGEDVRDRTPDPSRLVAGGVQARDLEIELTRRFGHHVAAAHEALSLPYELPFIRKDERSGKLYSHSADLLWAGLRTNQLTSEIVKLLMTIENTVGVKIGGSSDEAHIAGLAERLNPENRAGKLIFMLRLGLQEVDRYPTILRAINKHASNAITIFDIHGMTEKRPDGLKIRHVPSIIEGMTVMARACQDAGVKFGGVHLETTPDSTRFECIDELDQLPLHPGNIDPRLNPRQTRRVLNALAKITNQT